MSRREVKIQKIIKATIQILLIDGAGGLSMRKVAKQSDITLSNLQYYYKDMDALLEATIANYFDENEKEVKESMSNLPQGIKLEDLMRVLLQDSLMDGNSSERCAMFREIWALSTKNKKIQESVHFHYERQNQWLMQQFSVYTENSALVISLLMPYIEGYSLMGNALPIDKESLIEHWIKIILGNSH